MHLQLKHWQLVSSFWSKLGHNSDYMKDSAKHCSHNSEWGCCDAAQGTKGHNLELIRFCWGSFAEVPCHCCECTRRSPLELVILGIICIIHSPEVHVYHAHATLAWEIGFSWIDCPVSLSISPACNILSQCSLVIYIIRSVLTRMEHITSIEKYIFWGLLIESHLAVNTIPTVLPIWICFFLFGRICFTKFQKEA